MIKLTELKNALVVWRKLEDDAKALRLRGACREDVHNASRVVDTALDDIRDIVDSKPWSDIEKGL